MSFEGATLPDYTGGCLTQVLPSVAAQVDGVGRNWLGLPPASGYVVALVDGLGWLQLGENRRQAEFLGGLLPTSRSITCAAPSTTATSLTSLGTGRAPGEHGMVGYRFRNPRSGGVMNALSWDGGPSDVATFQPHPTVYEQLSGEPAMVALARFADSGLTNAAMRGATLVPVTDELDHQRRIEQVCEAARRSNVVYLYERMLDHTGHAHGVGSWQWLDQLAAVDDLLSDLRDALPPDVCLIVTGDHGMVNVLPDQYQVVEDTPGLAGYEQLAGEARFRYFYGSDPVRLAAKFADELGDRAWVATKSEAIAAGLFGKVSDQAAQRLGDVIVAMRDNWVLMTKEHPIEMQLAGVHGSLTAAEMLVPLIVVEGR